MNYKNIQELKDYYEYHGLELLDNTIGNSKTKHKCKDRLNYYYYLSYADLRDKRNVWHSIVAKYNPFSTRNIQQFIWNNKSNSVLLTKQYVANKSKMCVRCECGKEYKIEWDRMNNLTKVRCNKCNYSEPKYTFEELNEEVKKLDLVLNPNKVQKAHCLYVIDKDGKEYCTTIYRIRKGMIPSGKQSSLELLTKKYLDKKHIKYEEQKTFEFCKYKSLLKFDFYLPKYNTCIETDGKQHFEPLDYFGGEKRFNEQQQRDKAKNKYCKDNNITLIRIPYFAFNKSEDYKKYIDKIKI